MKRDTKPRARRQVVALFISLGVFVTNTSAGADRRYVKTKQGDRPKPSVAVDNACAWPNLTVMADETIIATIFNKPSHGQMVGDVDCWASVDGGRSWRKRGTAAPHEPHTTRMNVAAGRAKNGDLIVISSGWSNKYPQAEKGPPFRAGILDPWICRSPDGGRQWSIDKRVFPARGPRDGSVIPFGDIVTGDDGTLRVAIYEVIDRRDDRVWVYRSRDDGKTWGEPVSMDKHVYRNETALLHMGGGRWLAAIQENGLHLHASTDDGKTWHDRMRLTGPAHHPGHLLRLRNGRILLSHGNRTPNAKGVDVRWSGDEGKTWSSPIRVVDFEGDGGYPSSVQLPSGEVVTAYYAREIEVRWTMRSAASSAARAIAGSCVLAVSILPNTKLTKWSPACSALMDLAPKHAFCSPLLSNVLWVIITAPQRTRNVRFRDSRRLLIRRISRLKGSVLSYRSGERF